MTDSEFSDFYSEQNWFVRRWRDRHLLLVPIEAAGIWFYGERWKHAWSIARGLCDGRRNHVAMVTRKGVIIWHEDEEKIGKNLFETDW